MYYVLECYSRGQPVRSVATFPRFPGVKSWLLGQQHAAPVPEPIVLRLEPGDDVPPPVMVNSTILVMHTALVEALRRAGADNFDAYATILDDPAHGRRWEGYAAVNIIGAVAAADLARSRYRAFGGTPFVDVDFDSLVIDEARARGLRLFRLAECVSAVVVHEQVKAALLAAGFDTLTFVPPSEWLG